MTERLFKNPGITGAVLCASCCAIPIIGLALGVGTLTVLSRYLEWAGVGAIMLSALFFIMYLIKKRKQQKAPQCDIDCSCQSDQVSDSTQQATPIACDLSVFSTGERSRHQQQSRDIISQAKTIKELHDGYALWYDYSPELLVSFARWITGEHRCCPFFTFELVVIPGGGATQLVLNLRGSTQVKAFLKAEHFEKYG